MEGNLNNFRVGNIPTVICKPDFITENEEKYLLEKIYEAPLSKWKSLKNRRLQNWGGVVHEKGLLPQDLPPWLTKITQRIYEESGLFPAAMNHVLINEYLPHQGIMPHQDGPAYFPVVSILSLGSPVVMDFIPHSRLRTSMDALRNSVESEGSGAAGIEVNIETDEWMDNHHPFSVLLNSRSLLIFKDNAYSDYLHGIKDSEVHKYDEAVGDEGANDDFDQPLASEKAVEIEGDSEYKIIHRSNNRVSLTCRLVQKVHKNLFKF
ncbi:alkylated DNA repair protein ALKBH6 homolog isoform X2 [Euphorbia lathyris]